MHLKDIKKKTHTNHCHDQPRLDRLQNASETFKSNLPVKYGSKPLLCPGMLNMNLKFVCEKNHDKTDRLTIFIAIDILRSKFLTLVAILGDNL